MEPSHPADHGWIVRKTAITVDLAKIGKDPVDVIEEVWPVGVACQFGPDPSLAVRHLIAQSMYADAQIVNFFANVLALTLNRLQLSQLLLNMSQFSRRVRLATVAIACRAASFHHREQELSAS